MRKQLQDLRSQYQDLYAAYNQARRELDFQIQRTKSVDSALNTERNVRAETEIHCQVLQHTVSTIEQTNSKGPPLLN